MEDVWFTIVIILFSVGVRFLFPKLQLLLPPPGTRRQVNGPPYRQGFATPNRPTTQRRFDSPRLCCYKIGIYWYRPSIAKEDGHWDMRWSALSCGVQAFGLIGDRWCSKIIKNMGPVGNDSPKNCKNNPKIRLHLHTGKDLVRCDLSLKWNAHFRLKLLDVLPCYQVCNVVAASTEESLSPNGKERQAAQEYKALHDCILQDPVAGPQSTSELGGAFFSLLSFNEIASL